MIWILGSFTAVLHEIETGLGVIVAFGSLIIGFVVVITLSSMVSVPVSGGSI